jgi:hypothetical protein
VGSEVVGLPEDDEVLMEEVGDAVGCDDLGEVEGADVGIEDVYQVPTLSGGCRVGAVVSHV